VTDPPPIPADTLQGRLDEDPDFLSMFARLVRFFEWRNAPDPEEMAAETISRGLSRIAQGVTLDDQNLMPYLFGIAKNVLREGWRAQKRTPESLDDNPVLTDAGLDAAEQRLLVTQALATLSPNERDVFIRYHLGNRAALREELNVSSEALRVRVHRMAKKIRQAIDAGHKARLA
jgi:RNA polymerase sigma-70 factor (ECF subfamily)